MDKSKAVIILGTAHLGTTPGKQSPDGRLREAVYSRERVDAVAVKLKAYGYTVFRDYMPLEPNGYMRSRTAKEEQGRELEYRVNFVNGLCREYGKDCCLYVSLHVDAAGSGKEWMQAGGFTVFTSRGQTRADRLAECLYDAADANLGEYARMMYEGKARGFYGERQQPIRTDMTDLLHALAATAAVPKIAPGQVKVNEAQLRQDVEFLLGDAGKHAIERLHVEGIMKYVRDM